MGSSLICISIRSVWQYASTDHFDAMYAQSSGGEGDMTPPPVPMKTTRPRRAPGLAAAALIWGRNACAAGVGGGGHASVWGVQCAIAPPGADT